MNLIMKISNFFSRYISFYELISISVGSHGHLALALVLSLSGSTFFLFTFGFRLIWLFSPTFESASYEAAGCVSFIIDFTHSV